ncbi:MAG: ABC transporter substrate-binding protein [Thermomicrobiales bacterium]
MRRISRIAVFFIAGLLMVSGLQLAPTAAQDNTLVMARAADATGLDPHTQTAFASLRLLELIYEPLLTVDANLELVPVLAESWEFSEDGSQLTFHLREGVTFHDGSDFTSADVIASYERILDEATGSATRTNLLSIESMEAPDDHTVVLNLSIPDVPLLTALASTNAAILSSDVIASGDPTTDAIGTGPFKLDNWTPDQTTNLSANADWWAGAPKIDGIEMRIIPDESTIMAALRAGEIDFAMFNDPLIATLPTEGSEVVINRAPDIAYHVLQLRAFDIPGPGTPVASPSAEVHPLSILEVRQAISCAIDRQEVVDAAALGEGTVTGPLTMPSYALPTDQLFCYTKDLEKAKALMEQAGYADGFPLTIIAASAEPPTAITEAESIQSQLADINIDVTIEPLELSVYVDRWLAGDFDAAIALNGGRPDPYTMYARYFQDGAQFANVAGYIDDTLDQLMKQGQVELDPEARKEIFNQFQTHLAEVSPWIWLYTGYLYTGQQPYVVGFVPNPTGSLYSLGQVSLDR